MMEAERRFLQPLWLHRLSELRAWPFAAFVGLMLLGGLALEVLLLMPLRGAGPLPTPLPLLAVVSLVVDVTVKPLYETLLFVMVPCELMLNNPWVKRQAACYRWVRWFPLLWASVVFGALHLSKPLPFMLLTVFTGAVFLLTYLHVRPISPWTALRVTTYVHAGRNLVATVLVVGPYLI